MTRGAKRTQTMTSPISYSPAAIARKEAAAMRRLVKPAPGPLARFWAWLNRPL